MQYNKSELKCQDINTCSIYLNFRVLYVINEATKSKCHKDEQYIYIKTPKVNFFTHYYYYYYYYKSSSSCHHPHATPGTVLMPSEVLTGT